MSDKPLNEETKLIYHIDEESTPYLIKLNIPPENVTLETNNQDEDDSKSNSSKANNKSNINSRPSSFHSNLKKPMHNDFSDHDKNDSDQFFNDSESVHSANQDKIAPLKSFKPYKNLGRYSRMGNSTYDTTSSMLSSDIDSTVIYDSEDESRMSTATGTTLSSIYACQPGNFMRKKSKHYFKRHKKAPSLSRASSFSSITDSTMSLNIVSVTLPMETVTFLGISIVGQSNKASGDSGIYVGSIMKGGAVAHDGRIEPGDMLLEVNGISFENMSNDDAVKTLRDQVQRSGPITLVVAKCWDSYLNDNLRGDNNDQINEYSFTLPRNEPILPIDPRAWVLHNNAMLMSDNLSMSEMPPNMNGGNNINCAESTITAGSNGSLPMGASASMFMNNQSSNNHYPQTQIQNRNGTPSLTSSLPDNCRKSEMGTTENHQCLPECCSNLSIKSDLHCIIRSMRQPESGLEIKDRIWLKIVIPNAFIGSDLVEWLFDKVDGFNDHKSAKKFATELLKFGFIRHTVNKSSFSEQCYYVFGDNADQFMHNGGFVEPLDSISQAGHNNVNLHPAFFNSNGHQWNLTNNNNNSCDNNNQTNMIRVGSNSSCGQYSSVQSPVYPTPSTMSSGVALTSLNDSKTQSDTRIIHPSNGNNSQMHHISNCNNGGPEMTTSQMLLGGNAGENSFVNQNFNTLASKLSMSTSSSGSSSRRLFSHQSQSQNFKQAASHHLQLQQMNPSIRQNAGATTNTSTSEASSSNGQQLPPGNVVNANDNNCGIVTSSTPGIGGVFSRQQQGQTNVNFNGSNTSSTQRTITSNQTMITNMTSGLENSLGLISIANNNNNNINYNGCSPTASSDVLDIRPITAYKSPPPQPPPRLTPAANQV